MSNSGIGEPFSHKRWGPRVIDKIVDTFGGRIKSHVVCRVPPSPIVEGSECWPQREPGLQLSAACTCAVQALEPKNSAFLRLKALGVIPTV